jgi:hypothetical protein
MSKNLGPRSNKKLNQILVLIYEYKHRSRRNHKKINNLINNRLKI